MKLPFSLCLACGVVMVPLAKAEKLSLPAGTGRVHAAGTATIEHSRGKPEKLIGVLIEGMWPDAIKGKDVMLYFSDTPQFQWLLAAEGKMISFESRGKPELEEGKGKPRIFLFDQAEVKEGPHKPPEPSPRSVSNRAD